MTINNTNDMLKDIKEKIAQGILVTVPPQAQEAIFPSRNPLDYAVATEEEIKEYDRRAARGY